MSTEPIVAALAVALVVLVVAVIGLTGVVIGEEMFEEVNQKLPPERRYQNVFWGPVQKLALVRDYKRLCPNGPWLRRMRIYMTVIFAVGVIVTTILSSVWDGLFVALGGVICWLPLL